MAKSKTDSIALKGDYLIKEHAASAALKPGHLLEFYGAAVRKHATAKSVIRRAFALENDLFGKSKEDAYASGDMVRYASFAPGSEVNARLAASASAIVAGDKLEAAADGTVRKFTDGVVIGFALEAVDNSGGGAEVFIAIELL